jgi:uncharacterized protein YggE
MSEPPPRTVTVTGSASVRIRPDRATLNLGVQAFGPTAAEAMEVAAQRSGAVIAALRQLGRRDDELRTSALNLWYDQHERRFVASNQLSVTVPADAVGEHIDAAGPAAGDQFTLNGVSFTVSERGAHTNGLRAEALADARARATELAEAEGATVSEALTIVEGGAGGGPIPFAAKGRVAMDAMSMPVEGGSESLTLNVTVTYELR